MFVAMHHIYTTCPGINRRMHSDSLTRQRVDLLPLNTSSRQRRRRCRVVVYWCVSSRAGLQATWSRQLSVCRSTTVQCRRSSGAVVDLASQAAVVSAGRQPSTVRRTTDQATTAALSPATHVQLPHAVIIFSCYISINSTLQMLRVGSRQRATFCNRLKNKLFGRAYGELSFAPSLEERHITSFYFVECYENVVHVGHILTCYEDVARKLQENCSRGI